MATPSARSRRPVPTTRPDLAEPRVRRLAIGAALGALVIAGALGWLLGGILHGDNTAPAGISDRLTPIGSLRVIVDGSWAPTPAGKELAATGGLSDLTAFSPLPGLPGRSWVAHAPLDGPTLVPAALGARVTKLPAPAKVKLAGQAAWRYPAMKLRSGGLLEVTALPTTAGVLLVGCEASPTSWSTVVGCGKGIRAVGGAPVLAPSSSLAFRERLKPVVAKLNARRTGAGHALRRARHARGQQAAARRLAGAHRAAADALSPLAPAQGAERTAVRQLAASFGAYTALAKAAGRRDRRRYGRARAATRRADKALRAALAAAGR
jgi:hypothetical protein